MAGEFDGKVVVVTGANGNIGQVVARKFAEQGATLVLVTHDELLASHAERRIILHDGRIVEDR